MSPFPVGQWVGHYPTRFYPSLSKGFGGAETTMQKYKLFPNWQKIIFPEGTFCHRGKGWLLDIGKVGQHGGHDTLYQRDVFFGCEQHHLGINLEVMMGYLVPHSHHARPVQLRVTGKEFAM